MGAIRKLYVDLQVRSADAVKSLVAFGRTFQTVDKVVAQAATSIERNADRVAAALARVSSGAAQVRSAGGASGGSGGSRGSGSGAKRKGPDDLDKAISGANKSVARQSGLADGAKAIREATAALGPLATKSDRAKAAVADLAAQVARNRKEMADLRAETVKNGDSSGTLKARMQGLSVATGQASVALQKARKELRDVDGGLIDAVKNAGKLRDKFGALQVAAGNLISGGISTAFHSLAAGIVGATDKAIKFETEMISISKVSRGADDTKEGFDRITAGIKTAAKELGVLPTEVAALTAQLAPAFSDVSEGINGTKVDLVALTSDVTKIGVAWDITGKEAGKTFAEISSGLQLTTAETKSLFGGINELGNQLGTKASVVAEAVQRSAGVLKGANISGETGAALNAVLIKTGSSAEVAATGVRTFVARLGAGEAATKKQLHAFQELGLSAKAVAKELTSGDSVRAEKQIKEVVKAIGGLADDKKLPVLIELFGSESIGSIGAAATATDLLGQSFAIMSDKAASATSVQKEFDRVSQTSAVKMAKLKANVEVLAIEFGEALLPHLNKVVEFLTSPEGQEWGRDAVEKAVGAVTTLASAIGSIVGFFSDLADTVGGATAAFGSMGLALIALTGPYGMVLAGATALGAYLGKMYVDWRAESAETALQIESNLNDVALSLANANGVFGTTSDILVQMGDRADAAGRQWAEWMLKIVGTTAALEEFYAKDEALRGKKIETGKAAEDKARRESVDASQKAYAKRTQDAAIADDEAFSDSKSRYLGAYTKRSRFADLSKRVERGETLHHSEAKEYTRLSKELDEAKAKKAGKGHKQTKMDKQLAAIDPSLRGVLTGGGETDAGGDLKVHDDALSRAVFDRQTKGNGQGKDRSDGAGIGPGPNITNNYQYVNTTVTVPIDARSQGSASDNIRTAAEQAGQRLGGVIFTGAAKILAAKNAGGVMRSG